MAQFLEQVAHQSTESMTTQSHAHSAASRAEEIEAPAATPLDTRPSACPSARDEALDLLSKIDGATYHVTEAENRRVLNKIDWYLMPILVIIYFFQYLDKQALAFASVFGIAEDTHLVGNQYSLLGSVVYIAQLFFQPLSSYFLVRFRLATYVPLVVTLWGITLACMSAAKGFHGLMVTRFLLGGFESSITPAFILITQIWYRRQEQGYRISIWYSNNGWGNIFGSLIMYGLGHIKSEALYSYQIIFLLLGVLTVIVGSICFFVFPDNPVKSKFLTPDEKLIAVERLRANQQGLETKQFKIAQAIEMLLDAKSWCWMTIMFFISLPAGGITIFGPFILQGFGFDGYEVMLLSIPFGVLQVASIFASSWASQRFRMKSPAILIMIIPCIIGTTMLRVCGREKEDQAVLLAAYYILSSYTAITPLILNWHSTNVAGHTKKATTTAFMTMGLVGGNIAGPLLFTPEEGPYFYKGLSTILASFCACAILVGLTVVYLASLNKRNERRRVASGKPAKIIDYSMLTIEEAEKLREKEKEDEAKKNEGDPQTGNPPDSTPGNNNSIGKHAFDDLTDLQNDEFIYVY